MIWSSYRKVTSNLASVEKNVTTIYMIAANVDLTLAKDQENENTL